MQGDALLLLLFIITLQYAIKIIQED